MWEMTVCCCFRLGPKCKQVTNQWFSLSAFVRIWLLLIFLSKANGCSKEQHPFLWSCVQSWVLTHNAPGTLGVAPALQAMCPACQAFRDNGSRSGSFRSDSPNSFVTKLEVAVLQGRLGTSEDHSLLLCSVGPGWWAQCCQSRGHTLFTR